MLKVEKCLKTKIVQFTQIKLRVVRENEGIVLVEMEEMPHYKMLCGNVNAYKDYLKVCNAYDKKHTLAMFKDLIRNFDIKKAGAIHCDYIEEDDLYVTRDGNHRACILYYLGHKEILIKY